MHGVFVVFSVSKRLQVATFTFPCLRQHHQPIFFIWTDTVNTVCSSYGVLLLWSTVVTFYTACVNVRNLRILHTQFFYNFQNTYYFGPGSVVGWLWTVRGSNPGGEARFSAPVQTGPGAHTASCTMGTGSFPGERAAGAWSRPLTRF